RIEAARPPAVFGRIFACVCRSRGERVEHRDHRFRLLERAEAVMDLMTAAPDAPVFLTRKIRYVMGVDLGQSSDPTAISVIEHHTGVLDWRSERDRHCNITNTDTIPQKKEDRFNVLHLERLPLGMSYPDVIERVMMLLARPPLCADVAAKRAP